MTQPIVIVGGGHAAAQLCNKLAEAGAGGRVHLVCEESIAPYHRPPLSKVFLKTSTEVHQLHRDAPWYEQQGIQVHLGKAATAIDRQRQRIELASGEQLPYDWLVLATGTRARRLPQLVRPLANVSSLRSVNDAHALRERLLAGGSGALTIVGGGFIGLEVAATARHLGWSVTILEAAPRLLSRSASPEMAERILHHHLELGCTVKLGAPADSFQIEGDVLRSITVDGTDEPVDHLLVGIGAVAETTLAACAGLALDNGIAVDEHLVTSDPRILAIGDCSSFLLEGRRVRLESVQNANDQAKVAAATLLGATASYRPVPSFWSEQGTLRLQMVGLWREGFQAYRRPGVSAGSFSLFHYAGDRLACVESANAPGDHMMARKIVDGGRSPEPRLIMDTAIQLKSLLD